MRVPTHCVQYRGADDEEQTYQKCTVLGPTGLLQNFAKPPSSGAADVPTRRRSSGCRNSGRKLLKMRAPGRNDMATVMCGIRSQSTLVSMGWQLGGDERGDGARS
jgi:hypothetical protein